MVLTSRLRPLELGAATRFRELARQRGLDASYYDFTARLPGGDVEIERREILQPPVGVDATFLEETVRGCAAVSDYLGSPSFIETHLEDRLRQSTIELVEGQTVFSPALADQVRRLVERGYRPYLVYDVLACVNESGAVVPKLLEVQSGWGYVGFVTELAGISVEAGIEPAGGRYHHGADPAAALARLKEWARPDGGPIHVLDYNPLGRGTGGDIIHLAEVLSGELPLRLEDVVEDPGTGLPAFRKCARDGPDYRVTDDIVRPTHAICRATPLDVKKLKASLAGDTHKFELLHQFFSNRDKETEFLQHPLTYDLINKNHLGVLREALAQQGSSCAGQFGRTVVGDEPAPFGAYVYKPDDGNSGHEVEYALVAERGRWSVPARTRLLAPDGGETGAGEVADRLGTFRLERDDGELPRVETVHVADAPGWVVPRGYNLQERYRPAVFEGGLPDGSSTEFQVEVRALALPTVDNDPAGASVLQMVRLAPLRDGAGGIAHTNVIGGMKALDAIAASRVADGTLGTAGEVRDFFARANCAGMMPCRVS